MGNRGKLICFTGLDGAGKTTLSRSVADALRRQGINNRYVHSRLKPVFSRPFLLLGKALFLHGGRGTQSYQDYSRRKKGLFSHGLLVRGYRGLLSLDYCLQVWLRVALPLRMNRNIICDRYVYDTVILDLAANIPFSPEGAMKDIEAYLSVLPRPDLLFVVDVPEEVAWRRKEDIPSPEDLREARVLFQEVGQWFGAVTLDGNQPQEVVSRQAQEQAQALFSSAVIAPIKTGP